MMLGATCAIVGVLMASLVPVGNFTLFAMLYAGSLGACNGLSYTVPIKLGWQAYPENSGLVSGLIIGGFGLGSLVFTYLATLIVNPDNLNQTELIAPDGVAYMTFPESVTEQLPFFLQLLGLMYLVLGLTAVILVKDSSENAPDNFVEDTEEYCAAADAESIIERESITSYL